MEDRNAQDSTRNAAPEESQASSALPPDLRASSSFKGAAPGQGAALGSAAFIQQQGQQQGQQQAQPSLDLPVMGQTTVATADPSREKQSPKSKSKAGKSKASKFKQGKTKGKKQKQSRKETSASPQTAAQTSAPTSTKTSAPRTASPLKWGLKFGAGLLGLGCIGVAAGLAGVAIAHVFPQANPSENAPLLEKTLVSGSRTISSMGRWPKQLTQGLLNRLDPPAQPQLEAAAPILTNGQRQQIGNDVAALQNELAQINVRAAILEQQLGYEYTDAPMELRLEALAQTLANPTAGPQSVANRDRNRQPLLVTLPLDPLFETNQSQLKPASTALLGAIVSELRSYPEGIVTIGAHSDDVGAGPVKRELSRRRAGAVAEYLQVQVGDTPNDADKANNRFLWHLVGYGDSDPLVPNESNANRQRNRRLEIRVTPR